MDAQTRQCSQCKGTVSQDAQECPACGIIFKRYEEARDKRNLDGILIKALEMEPESPYNDAPDPARCRVLPERAANRNTFLSICVTAAPANLVLRHFRCNYKENERVSQAIQLRSKFSILLTSEN